MQPTIIIAGSITLLVVSIVIFYFLLRKAPRGVLLIVAALIYASSFLFGTAETRMGKLAIGATRMIGFVGGILGLIDLFRSRDEDGAEQNDKKHRGTSDEQDKELENEITDKKNEMEGKT